MTLETLPMTFTVCQPADATEIDLNRPWCFAARTEEELSLVCPTALAPSHTLAREDGWRGFRIRGVLDFSLIGILSRISGILAAAQVGIFAVSTYNTDYVFVRQTQWDAALSALQHEGYEIA